MTKHIIFSILIFHLSCVQEMRDITIHFIVDMRDIDKVNSIGVIGEYLPLTWDAPTVLTDQDNDGIYEGTITIKAAYHYAAFKFMLNETIIELEGKGNRVVRFPDAKEVTYTGKFDVSGRLQ